MYGKLTSQYFELAMTEMKIITMLEDKKQRKEFGESIIHEVFQTGGPKVTSNNPSRKDKFIANKIFRPMSEIIKTIEAIENIGIYIRSFPYTKHAVSPLSYLQYHVENYLNEIYIFKNRLVTYLDILKKAYGKTEHGGEILKILMPLYSSVSDTLKPYTVVRGIHVHELRHSDPELSRLSTLELLSRAEDDFGKLMKSLFLKDYRTTRNKWAQKIKREIGAIKKLLDYYFGQLTKAVFQDKRLIIPKNYR